MNLKLQNQPLVPEISRAFNKILLDSSFVGGEILEAFELDFARFCQSPFAVGCSSGSSALHLALLSLGIQPGDEVITSPYTFTATAEAIRHAGAKPVFADIDPKTYNLDPAKAEACITPKTKALLPIHLFGNPCDMQAFQQLAQQHHLFLIEDCAQAHGAAYQGRAAGSLGDAGCFSFYPAKNLGAGGEAGALVLRDPEAAQRARALRNHGRQTHQLHTSIGFNYRLDNLQACMLKIKLRCLRQWNRSRQKIAKAYADRLSSVANLILPFTAPQAEAVYHLYVIQTPERDKLSRSLEAAGIGSAVHYSLPLHLQPAYADLGYKPGDFPVAETLSQQALSLPIYPGLTLAQVNRISRTVKTALA